MNRRGKKVIAKSCRKRKGSAGNGDSWKGERNGEFITIEKNLEGRQLVRNLAWRKWTKLEHGRLREETVFGSASQGRHETRREKRSGVSRKIWRDRVFKDLGEGAGRGCCI